MRSEDLCGLPTSEFYEFFCFPGELDSLVSHAERFPKATNSCGDALHDQLGPLADAMIACGYGLDQEGEQLILLVYGAVIYPGEVPEAWRTFGQLPEEEQQRLVDAAWAIE